MGKCYFSKKAEKDIEAILDYSKINWGKIRAQHYLEGLEKVGQTLANNPEIGISRNIIQKGLRSFPYESHEIFYCPEKYGVTVIRILHKAMLPAKYL